MHFLYERRIHTPELAAMYTMETKKIFFPRQTQSGREQAGTLSICSFCLRRRTNLLSISHVVRPCQRIVSLPTVFPQFSSCAPAARVPFLSSAPAEGKHFYYVPLPEDRIERPASLGTIPCRALQPPPLAGHQPHASPLTE